MAVECLATDVSSVDMSLRLIGNFDPVDYRRDVIEYVIRFVNERPSKERTNERIN